MMLREKLKASLTKYPTEGWQSDLELRDISESEFIAAIIEILTEFGRFPVPWSDGDGNSGLFVSGSGDSYVGHWKDVDVAEDGIEEVSLASEDLGPADMAAGQIYRTYFARFR